MIERFKNERIVIRVKTEQEYKNLMKLLEKHNLKWCGGDKATSKNYWEIYKENTCICYNYYLSQNSLGYCSASFYTSEGYKIIEYKDFIKGVEMKFTKKDLKVGDIITLRNGKRGTYEGKNTKIDGLFYYNIENDLTNNGLVGKSLDIVKVERTRKIEVLYERKEEILDEAEKRYLRDVIRPFRNEVKYIKLEKSWSKVDCCYVLIETKSNDTSCLPYFKIGTMYKGMKLNKEYSVKELGL